MCLLMLHQVHFGMVSSLNRYRIIQMMEVFHFSKKKDIFFLDSISFFRQVEWNTEDRLFQSWNLLRNLADLLEEFLGLWLSFARKLLLCILLKNSFSYSILMNKVVFIRLIRINLFRQRMNWIKPKLLAINLRNWNYCTEFGG